MKGHVCNTLDRSMERMWPNTMDVCLGRGKSFRNNPGNALLQDLVNANRIRYFDSSKAIKREITNNILSTIQQEGRFVRFMDNQWIVISDVEARQKIAHAIQYRIRNEVSQPKSGLIASDPPEPTSSTRAIVPKIVPEKKILELKQEHQLATDKPFNQSFHLSNPMTMNQMYCSNLRFSSQYSTGEQEQEQGYRHEILHPESPLEQFDEHEHELSQPITGLVTFDPPEPTGTSSTIAIVPKKGSEKRTLEMKEEHQLTTDKHFHQSFQISNPMSINQMYCCDASCSSEYSTFEQEQEQSYLQENVHPESLLEKFDAPQPLQDFIPFYLQSASAMQIVPDVVVDNRSLSPFQATTAMQRVSDVVVDNRSLSPFSAFTAKHPINLFTHEGQRAVSDCIDCKSYENSQIKKTQQDHNLHRNIISSHTIQNSCVMTNLDRFPSSSMKLDDSFDPLPLQRQHSFSSTDVGDIVSPPIFLASESINTIDTFMEPREPEDSPKMAKQLENGVVQHPDAFLRRLSSIPNHPYHNLRQDYEVTTAENIMQQLQQIGAIPMNHSFISHPNHHAKGTEVGFYNSALSLLSTVSMHHQEIASAQNEVLQPGLLYISSKSLDDFTSTPVLPVAPIEAFTITNYQI